MPIDYRQYPITNGYIPNPIAANVDNWNVKDINQNQILRDRGFGDVVESEFAHMGPDAYNRSSYYDAAAQQSYEDAISGRGGYTPEERAQIISAMRDPQQQSIIDSYQEGYARPGEYDGMYMTGDEQGAVVGNPYAALSYLNPEGLKGYADDARTRTQQAIERGRGRLDAAIDPNLYGGAAFDAYSGKAEADIADASARAYGAVNPGLLRQDPNFKNEYVMSQGDVDAYGELAGRAARTNLQGQLDEYTRHAAASGGTSGLARAAMANRMGRQGAIAGADAAVSARLGADAQRRDQIGNAEQMRIGAEQGYADVGSNTALGVGDMVIRARGDIEDRRYRQGAALGDARLRAGMYLTDQEIGAANTDADRGIGIGQYVTDTGAAYTAAGDQASSDRNKYTSEARRGVEEYRVGDRFNRTMNIKDRQLGGTQNMADRGVNVYNTFAGNRLDDTRRGQDFQERGRDFYGEQYTARETSRDRNRALAKASEGDSLDRYNQIKRSGKLTKFAEQAGNALFARASKIPIPGLSD